MNHPVVSQNGRDWARVTVLSLCAGVGLIAPLSGYPIVFAAEMCGSWASVTPLV